MLELNVKGKETLAVSDKDTALAVGSGQLEVFSTPSMIALMEKTASESVQSYMEDGMGTVGIAINIRHVSATSIGQTVTCESRLVKIDGKRLEFQVKAIDAGGLIGEGIHERFVVNNEKFLAKMRQKESR
jgi:predicted thioesterase